MAADYEPPSFSLGLDFDLGFDSELQTAPPSPPHVPVDEIEEFSSPEPSVQDVHRSTQYQTSCSSSKVPLRASGILTSQVYGNSIGRKRNQVSDVPASVSLEANRSEFVFPKLTMSPLRRFQLIDSDSDDPSVSHSVNKVTSKIDPSSKKHHTGPSHSATTSGTNKTLSTSMPVDVDLWKHFSPVKKCNIPTPALDEVCQEYFQSMKNKTTQNQERDSYLHTNKNFHEMTPSGQNVEQLWDAADPLPPAHHYFFHDDPKIRKLVCNRLPNFLPLGAITVSGNQQKGASGPSHSATTSGTNKTLSTSMPVDVDLWKHFSPVKKCNIPTPALDEVCQEYFQSMKNKTTQNQERDSYLHTNRNFHEMTPSGQNVEQLWDAADPLPPAHHYFFHDDPKIRKLVCNRLPNFLPLGAITVSGNQQKGASVIDYMGQFSNGEASKQNVNRRRNVSNAEEVLHGSGSWVNPKGKTTQKASVKRNVNKGRNKSAKSKTGNVEQASGNWVEPKISASKKRVQANAQPSGEWPSQSGQASGHWYTGPGGRKVYVSKTGKELTGRTAYNMYSKESGKRPAKTRKGKAKK